MRLLLVGLGQFGKIMETIIKQHGSESYTADPSDDVHDLAKVYEYDCVVVGQESLNVIPTLSKQTRTPILAICDDVQGRVDAINQGADDAWFTTITPTEAVARLFAMDRRHRGGGASTFNFGPFVIDYDAKTVECNGTRIHLTGKEYQMLELMCQKPKTPITKAMFLNKLYGGMDEPELKIIDVFIAKLRNKLGAANNGAHYIVTDWAKHGFKLVPPDPQ